MSRLLWFLGGLAVLALLVFGWSEIARARLVSPVFLPGPERVWAALRRGFATGQLTQETLQTLRRMVFGWVLASLAGVALGALIGVSATARAWLQPTLEAVRPLPASAIAPVAVVFLGLSDSMVLALVAFGSMWPMLLTTIHGFSTLHPRLGEVSRTLGLGRLAFIAKIALPAALPDILGGLRLGLTIALILAVVGEMITAQGGLGAHILLAARGFRSAEIFAGVALLGAIGLVSNGLLGLVEARALRWKPR
jgi:ABC-type nitrate/sulfonate/bicarbonate transport system permease component